MSHDFFIDVLKDMEFIKEEKKEEVNKFYDHLANSCKSVLGEVSLKKLWLLLEPHIGSKWTESPSKTMN